MAFACGVNPVIDTTVPPHDCTGEAILFSQAFRSPSGPSERLIPFCNTQHVCKTSTLPLLSSDAPPTVDSAFTHHAA